MICASLSSATASCLCCGDQDAGATPRNFRGDPAHSGGAAEYENVELPREVRDQCIAATRDCGLLFAGIDIKQQHDDWVFLELNSSPIYLDVELKLGHPISAAIADMLVEHVS